MVSVYARDPDREFFEIYRTVYPYILYADEGFAKELILLMREIDSAHNDIHHAGLHELVEKAKTMISQWESNHGGTTIQIIRRHLFRVKSFEDRLEAIEEQVRKKREGKDVKELREKIEELEKDIISEKNAQTNASEEKNAQTNVSEVIPLQERPKCCGRYLHSYRKQKDGTYQYRCTKKSGGCGRLYISQNGIIPTCQTCGHPLQSIREKLMPCPECNAPKLSVL